MLPAAPAPKPDSGRPVSPLTPAFQKEIAQSPTLSKQITALTKSGWVFKYGKQGGGTFADRTSSTITIDPAESKKPEVLLESLAHEAGHASRGAPRFQPISPSQTKAQFVKANVHQCLLDEADATINNIKVKHELAESRGLSIGVAGANAAKYEEAYKQDPASAREKIAEIFGAGERPSNQPNSTYNQYYGKVYEDYYDKMNPAKK
jgi:hypothetical protein